MGFWSKYSSTKNSISCRGKEKGDGGLNLIELSCGCTIWWFGNRNYLQSGGKAVWFQVLIFHAP